jgi:hypothetical protein
LPLIPILGFKNSLINGHSPPYCSVHNYADNGDKIPPSLPLTKGGIPLFGKEGSLDMARGHEPVEWLGEIWEVSVPGDGGEAPHPFLGESFLKIPPELVYIGNE